MKVILREDVQGVGNIGDILEVAPGYARNFLLPRNKAVEAIGRNLKSVEHAKRVIAEKAERIRREGYALFRKGQPGLKEIVAKEADDLYVDD